MLKVNNVNTKTICEICSKLTIKTPDRRHLCRSDIFMVNFEQISHCFGVSIVGFERVNAGWEVFVQRTIIMKITVVNMQNDSKKELKIETKSHAC